MADHYSGITVFIRHIFLAKPLLALAVLACMGTILALFKLNRRKPLSRSDRFLVAFLGLLTIYEGIKILKDAGVVQLSVNNMLNDAIELLVAMACLSAAILLQMSRVNHLDVESAMRLARAAPPRSAHPDAPMPPKDVSTIDTLMWAIPRLSDGAFKLLAVLCLRSEGSSGRVPVGVTDVQLKLNRSKDELDTLLKELQESGAVALHRKGATLDVEIVMPSRRPSLQEPHMRTPALATESRT
jgi:hypothetical protein